jgi:hypothetical protein
VAVAVPDVALRSDGARQAGERHDHPNRVLGWGEALRRALAVIRTPKPVVALGVQAHATKADR